MKQRLFAAFVIVTCLLAATRMRTVWKGRQSQRQAEAFYQLAAAVPDEGSASAFWIFGPGNRAAAERIRRLQREVWLSEAMRELHRSINWNAGNERALELLYGIGDEGEKAGEYARALKAYLDLRAALSVSRTLWQPGKKWLALANERITALLPGTDQQKHDWARELEKPDDRKLAALVLTWVAFLAWILMTVLTIVKGFNPQGGFRRKPGLAMAGAAVALLMLWIFSLSGVGGGRIVGTPLGWLGLIAGAALIPIGFSGRLHFASVIGIVLLWYGMLTLLVPRFWF